MKNKKVVIFGISAFAEIAYEYFESDSDYEVCAFCVDQEYLTKSFLFNLPVVSKEDINKYYPPSEYEVFVAITYINLNYLRSRIVNEMKSLGYKLASYVSSKAFMWKNVSRGEHCFIFENNTIQPFVKIMNNVIIWSGNHIGHHSIINDNCFISSHVVISGFCSIGKNSFLGVNSTIANNIQIGENNWIGPSVLISKSTAPDLIFNHPSPEPSKVSSLRFFKISISKNEME